MSEWIWSSSALILIVAAVRYLFRGKISLRLQYAVWALVLLRLLIPFSIFELPQTAASRVPEMVEQTVSQLPALHAVPGDKAAADNSAVSESTGSISPRVILRSVWYCGMAVTAGAFILSNFSFYMRLRRTRRAIDADCRLPVYAAEGLPSPCMLLGKVYITCETQNDPASLRHVLAHECAHFRHLDGLWSALRCTCLIVHWYNPLVWWAAALSKRDGELACDEDAIKALGESERISYGRTLIGLTAAGGTKNILRCATTMTGGKNSLKERITLIAKRPKHIFLAAVAVILVCALAAGCSFSGTKTSGDPVGELKQSMSFTKTEDGTVMLYYTPPKGVQAIDATGRYLDDNGNGISYHETIPVNPGVKCEYSPGFQRFTELYFEVTLTGGTGYAGEIDVLAIYESQGLKKGMPATLSFSIEGQRETVAADYWSLGVMAILIPAEDWSRLDSPVGTLSFSPDANSDVTVTFSRVEGKTGDEAAQTLSGGAKETGSGNWNKIGGIIGRCQNYSSGASSIDVYTLETGGYTYAVECRYPTEMMEGWGTRVRAIADSLCFYAGGDFAPTGLMPGTSTGVGVMLDYADKNIAVFHGYFGVFVYDIQRQQIVLALDLMSTVGSTNIQGSEGASVAVSKDGKTLMLWKYTESGSEEKAMYVNTADGSYRFGEFKEMTDAFYGDYDSVTLSDGTVIKLGETDYTLSGLTLTVGSKTYSLFENYFQ